MHLLHLVGILFPHIIDDARSKPHQTLYEDYIRPSITWHQRLNRLLDFHEVQFRSSLQEVIEQTRVS
jgi:hypothetical protein